MKQFLLLTVSLMFLASLGCAFNGKDIASSPVRTPSKSEPVEPPLPAESARDLPQGDTSNSQKEAEGYHRIPFVHEDANNTSKPIEKPAKEPELIAMAINKEVATDQTPVETKAPVAAKAELPVTDTTDIVKPDSVQENEHVQDDEVISHNEDTAPAEEAELTAAPIDKQVAAKQAPVAAEAQVMLARAVPHDDNKPDGIKTGMAAQTALRNEYEARRYRLMTAFKNSFARIHCGLVSIDDQKDHITYRRGAFSYTTSNDGEITKAELSPSISMKRTEKSDTAFFKWFVEEISNRAGTIHTASWSTYSGADAAQCFLLQGKSDIGEYVKLFTMSAELAKQTPK